MSDSKKFMPAATLCILLSIPSTPGSAQEQAHQPHQNNGQPHSAQAFSDKEAIAKMAKNFESPARDSMQQPSKVLQYLGNISGKKIMDLGAATGYFSLKFAAAGAEVIAADVSAEFQDYLRDRIAKAKIRNITLRKIPYDNPLLKDKEADIVFVANTYHHIANRVTYFKQVKQGLKSGGAVVILDFFKVPFSEQVQAPAMGMRASVDEVVAELKQAGFNSFDVAADLLPYQYIIKAW